MNSRRASGKPARRDHPNSPLVSTLKSTNWIKNKRPYLGRLVFGWSFNCAGLPPTSRVYQFRLSVKLCLHLFVYTGILFFA